VLSVRVTEVIVAVEADVSIAKFGKYVAAVTTVITDWVVAVGPNGEAIGEPQEYAVVNDSCPPDVPLLTVVPAIKGEAHREVNPAGFEMVNVGSV